PDGRPWDHLFDEPVGQRLGQRRDGEFLLVAENRADSAKGLQDKGRRKGRCVRLHRALLQPPTEALDTGLPEPCRVRGESYVSLTWCPRNRQQASVGLRQLGPCAARAHVAPGLVVVANQTDGA